MWRTDIFFFLKIFFVFALEILLALGNILLLINNNFGIFRAQPPES